MTPLLQAAPTAQMRYASGVIKSWNAESFENVIEVRGSELINLPVLSGPDALTYKAGDVVSLIGADQQGARGIASYAILGRLVVPGAGRAEQAIEWMTSELGRAIAASVFADRVKGDEKSFGVSCPDLDVWQDGNFAGTPDPGPTVELEITKAGAAIVIISTSIGSQDGAEGWMGYEITGATNPPISPHRICRLRDLSDPPEHVGVMCTNASYVVGLNPGVHRFQAKYRQLILGDNGSNTGFGSRSMTVIGF